MYTLVAFQTNLISVFFFLVKGIQKESIKGQKKAKFFPHFPRASFLMFPLLKYCFTIGLGWNLFD